MTNSDSVPPASAPAATAGTEPLVIADPSVPRNEVHFRDARGKTVGKIVNLAPAAPTGEEAETGCECFMSSSPYPEPNADGSCPLCGKRSRRVAVETLDYPAAARSIALNLAEFCDESLAYPEMIAEAARQAATELAALREDAQRWRFVREHYTWLRRVDDDEVEQTYLEVRMPLAANLSCAAMCDDAIDRLRAALVPRQTTET